MLVHNLTVVQLKDTFVSDDGRICHVDRGLHYEDARSLQLHGVVALTISVVGTDRHYQRLYTGKRIPVGDFLRDAWISDIDTLGVPDHLVADPRILELVNLEYLAKELSLSEAPKITPGIDRKYAGSKRSAQSVTFRGSFNRLHNPRTEAHIELDWTQQYVSGSLPTRKQQDKLDYLLGFQPKPVVSLSMPGYMEVKDWVRESTKTVERLADDERLLLMHSNDVVDEFIVCFREANTNGTTRIRNGAAQPIRLGESEGVVRSIHALTYYDRTQLFKTLGLEYDLKYWKIADPLDSINNIIICGYLKTKVKLFFVNLPESIAPILTCLGSDLYRIARLPTSKANSQNTNLVVCETGNSFHTEIIVFALHCENQYSRDNFLKAIPLIHTLQIDLDNALAKLEELQHCLHPNSKFITYIADLLLGCTEWSHLPQHVISVKQSGFKLPSVEQLTTAKKATPLEIPRKSEFVPNREMIILGLQALHRERVTASQSFARYMDGKDSLSLPSMSFGVDEVLGALKEMGEVP